MSQNFSWILRLIAFFFSSQYQYMIKKKGFKNKENYKLKKIKMYMYQPANYHWFHFKEMYGVQ